jgi:predicted RecB family nuclease
MLHRRNDRGNTMSSNNVVTAAVFAAHLKCPTKAVLLARGEKPANTFFTEMGENISMAYKAKFKDISSLNFSDLVTSHLHAHARLTASFVDSETAFYSTRESAAFQDHRRITRPANDYIPVLYSPWDKLEQSDRLIVSFGALAISQATGAETPPNGQIIFGYTGGIKRVRNTDLLARTRHIIGEIVTNCHSEEPRLVLNKHCSVCDFQSRCRSIAINRDDLSLLGAMAEKERAKCSDKGITTITQLSYGYRPRRRKRTKSTASRAKPPVRHDHKLKALAVKKEQIHVVGSPALGIDGTPVFIDVEGMANREVYYLVGLRYQTQGRPIERSFWADRPEDQFAMWQDCLRSLKEIQKPRLIHYGAYESRFLKLMRSRWTPADEDAAFVDQLIDTSTNLVSSIYGKIYFPSYSNGLKDIARWLGFKWTLPQASGGAAVLLRRCWELTSKDQLREELIAYNMEDCRAAELVADAIKRVCSNEAQEGGTKLETVNVSSLEVGFQRTFGKFPSALLEFEKINAAAYWDYQRSKVYARTNKVIRQSIKKATKPIKKTVVEKEVTVDDKPGLCPRCGLSKVWIARHLSNVIFDLKFTRRGIKRYAVRYRYSSYRCGACKVEMTPYTADSKYGSNLRAYIIYLLMEMRLSQHKITEHIATVFDVSILKSMVQDIKESTADKYEPTYRAILQQIAGGLVVHADETKGVVYGGGHYVWIFANLTSVAYVYSASREASTVDEVLAGFKGVLVSDFYSAYDSIPCRQQKCLIHLMRDINEALLKHPFNEELTFVARRFGTLLRDIVETIDRYGLKKFHLGKHRRSAERFLTEVASLHCSTEVGAALKKRIDKNKDKLFTFLDHDGIPWNNNNAEHAVRAFTRLRNGMATSTPKGTTDYCVLLSLQQTLRCRGIGFLDFLRSSNGN